MVFSCVVFAALSIKAGGRAFRLLRYLDSTGNTLFQIGWHAMSQRSQNFLVIGSR